MKWKNSLQHRPAGRPWWGFPQSLSRCCLFQIWWRITWFLMFEESSLKISSHIGNHSWPGPLGLWNKRNCCGLVEVLLLSSRFLFPCLPQRFTRTAEYLPATLWPTRLQDWHLNLWKVWKATQQRSPWAVPLTTAHARALTNEPRLPPQCVHIPTKGGRTTPLLEI